MKETLAKTMAKSLADIQSELEAWAEELGKLQNLQPIQLNANQLKTKDIPALEEQIREKESIHPDITQAAEAVCIILCFHDRVLSHIFRSQRNSKSLIATSRRFSH
jgi:DNA repair protein RAD50